MVVFLYILGSNRFWLAQHPLPPLFGQHPNLRHFWILGFPLVWQYPESILYNILEMSWQCLVNILALYWHCFAISWKYICKILPTSWQYVNILTISWQYPGNFWAISWQLLGNITKFIVSILASYWQCYDNILTHLVNILIRMLIICWAEFVKSNFHEIFSVCIDLSPEFIINVDHWLASMCAR